MRASIWRVAVLWIASANPACGPDDPMTRAGVTPDVLPPTAPATSANTAGQGAGAAGSLGTGTPLAGARAPVPPPSMGVPPVMSPAACDASSRDGDADGMPDCLDGCPADRAKTAAGVCGCGVADADSDADGTPDCKDGCPRDPASAPALGSRCGSTMMMTGAAGAGPAPMPMGNPNPGSCPAGFESDLPLVMTGATVPGNLELGLASAPETPRNPCGLPEEQECFNMLNAERMAVGKAPLRWDGDLVDIARSHAADRTQHRYPGTMHGSSTSDMHLYEQRGAFVGLKKGKFKNVVENALTGGRTASSAVKSWMGSSGHRAVIIGDGQWATFTHAGCGRDGSEWNIEFGR